MSDLGIANNRRSYRLLIVDDDDIDRRHYGRLLAQHAPGRCEIQQAGSGAAGLAALRTCHVDCVLLDFNLPDMTGLEFLTAAAAGGALPCAVVLVTGQGNEAIAVEAMKRGVQDYLVKDRVNANSLWRAMTTAVTQTELRQRLARSLRELTAANAALEREAAIRAATEAELRAAKEAAEHSNQAKTRFVAMVTHELRTPLNGILGYAQLLRIEGGLSPLQDARVSSMMQAGQHLLRMIEQVLDVASIEAGRMEMHPVRVSVRELSEQGIAFITPLAAEHALSLRTLIAADAPREIIADPSRLRQVLLNLLGNAVKYTVAGGVELRVLAGAAPGGLRLEVADTGPGIHEGSLGHLFRDFERLDAGASVEGAGLGLAIAARIVGLMGGRIGHAANPGGGSVFWVDVPTADVELPPAVDAVEPPPPPCGMRVLLVDDMAMNRDVIGAFLRAAGHSVDLAEGGEAALRMASETPFDLILMDVRMPRMDGLEATRRIRALPAPHGRVPILALTAYTFFDQLEQCRDAGMDGHIAKPVDYATLRRAIADAVAPAAPGWDVPGRAPPLAGAGQQPSPRLDLAVLEQTLAFLEPDEIVASFQALRTRVEQMLDCLDRLADQSDAGEPAREIAHKLVSAAGMFGLVALSAASGRFERAVANDAAAVAQLAREVREESRAALVLLDTLLCERRGQAA